MTDALASVPLVGAGPVLVVSAVALACLVFAVLLWRGHKLWRWVFVGLFVVVGLGAGADAVNTKFAYIDNLADLLGIPTYPTGGGAQVQPGESHPDGVVVPINIDDKASGFGAKQALVYLPPQYFSDTRAHFPVMLLAHGNPGDGSAFLTSMSAQQTALAVAQGGKPVILVMPNVLKNSVTSDSLCVDSPTQGLVETYLTKDVISSVDAQLRTEVDPKGRGIGGYSMGGFCALNLGLKHPDLFSTVIDMSGEIESNPDAVPGGNKELYGGADWQQQADANSPDKYVNQLAGSKGPAIWMDVGKDNTEIVQKMQSLLPQLKAKGFTVELHVRDGAHDFSTWTAAFKEALPWAAQRMSPEAS